MPSDCNFFLADMLPSVLYMVKKAENFHTVFKKRYINSSFQA
jgi:hypothetical protein